MSHEDDDSYADEPDTPPLPGSVRAAGAIWIAIGSLWLMGTGFLIEMGGGRNVPLPPCAVCTGALFAMALMWVGLQTLQGRAAGTLWSGIGSVVLSLPSLTLAGIVSMSALSEFNRGRLNGQFATAVVIFDVLLSSLGMLPLVSGFLALAGRTRYKAWRAYHHPPRRCTPDETEGDPGP